MGEIGIMRDDGRFHLRTEHGEAELLYRIEEGKMEIYRTFVPDEDRHRGIARELMDDAVKYAEEHGLTVVASCEYAHTYMDEKGGKEGENGT